jgi:hypothetical protein
MTSPVMAWLNSGPWRHGVAVISRWRGRVAASNRGRPRFESDRVAAQAGSAGHCVDDDVGRAQQRAAGGVEVVGVVVVAAQHGVDWREVGRGDRRTGDWRDGAPQPKEYRRPGGSRAGSVRSRHPPTSTSAVGPPT